MPRRRCHDGEHGEHHHERRHEPVGTTQPERAQANAARALSLFDQQRRDQKAAEHEEQVHTQGSVSRPRDRVIADDHQDRHSPKAIECRPVTHAPPERIVRRAAQSATAVTAMPVGLGPLFASAGVERCHQTARTTCRCGQGVLRGRLRLQGAFGLECGHEPVDVGVVVVRGDRDPQQPATTPFVDWHFDPVTLEQGVPERNRVTRRKLRGPHPRSGCTVDRRQKFFAAVGDRPAVVEVEAPPRVDRGGDRQPRRRVEGSLPLVLLRERSLGSPAAEVTTGSIQRMLGPRPQERRSLWRTQPLVAVAGVDVRAELLQVERGGRARERRRRRRRARVPGGGARLRDR